MNTFVTYCSLVTVGFVSLDIFIVSIFSLSDVNLCQFVQLAVSVGL